jgi:uncharacterized protein (TIGR02145 family)
MNYLKYVSAVLVLFVLLVSCGKSDAKDDKGQLPETDYVKKDNQGNDVKNGLYTEWYKTGNKQSEYTYKDDKKDGSFITWNKSGQKELEGTYKDDKLDGIITEWYKNGRKKSEITWKDGKEDGPFTLWDESGYKCDPLTDIDGNVYKTVKIGNQLWMAENLRTTRYNDGSPILLLNKILITTEYNNGGIDVIEDNRWTDDTRGAYCYYDFTSDVDTIKEFGALYNWYAVGTKKLAPVGWHVPTDDDWNTLVNYLVDNDKIKNSRSGFMAINVGRRNDGCQVGGCFYDQGGWWSATKKDASLVYICKIEDRGDSLFMDLALKNYGFSVRLVRDGKLPEMPSNEDVSNGTLKKTQENMSENKKKIAIDDDAFLAKNRIKAGVTTTASGLQYSVIKQGAGPSPKATDIVKVKYVGTLIDGKEFDSSIKRGQPAEFSLNGIIPGLTEALQLMNVGSKYRIVVPANLAYGEQGAGGIIPPNATLIFDVELLDIVR